MGETVLKYWDCELDIGYAGFSMNQQEVHVTVKANMVVDINRLTAQIKCSSTCESNN